MFACQPLITSDSWAILRNLPQAALLSPCLKTPPPPPSWRLNAGIYLAPAVGNWTQLKMRTSLGTHYRLEGSVLKQTLKLFKMFYSVSFGTTWKHEMLISCNYAFIPQSFHSICCHKIANVKHSDSFLLLIVDVQFSQSLFAQFWQLYVAQ